MFENKTGNTNKDTYIRSCPRVDLMSWCERTDVCVFVRMLWVCRPSTQIWHKGTDYFSGCSILQGFHFGLWVCLNLYFCCVLWGNTFLVLWPAGPERGGSPRPQSRTLLFGECVSTVRGVCQTAGTQARGTKGDLCPAGVSGNGVEPGDNHIFAKQLWSWQLPHQVGQINLARTCQVRYCVVARGLM